MSENNEKEDKFIVNDEEDSPINDEAKEILFYDIKTGINKNLTLEEIQPENIIFGYITLRELENIYENFGFSESTLKDCKSEKTNFRNSIDVYDTYSFGLINIVDLKNVMGNRDRFAFYIKKNLFLAVEIFDKDHSTKDVFLNVVDRMLGKSVTLEKAIYGFFEGLLYGDSGMLESYEMQMTYMEEKIEHNRPGKDFNLKLLDMKKELLLLRNYYEQLIDIGEELQENQNELFEEKNLRYFKIFTDKSTRHSNTIQMLRDNLIHLREAYEATLDYNLNSIMKTFTVVTTIFMPLTLIVGWYGMNFANMPELTWKYGYASVIGICIAVVITCFIYFKKKHFM